jgi:type II secretory pathway pseudopilin PulG
LIICPACGSSVEGQLSFGCPACGARAVGPPLAKPEHQLVSYGPAALTAAVGGVVSLGFLTLTLIAWITKMKAVPRLSMIVSAGETAAWQLKWVALPFAVAVIWTGSKSVRAIRNVPHQFGGLRTARAGYCAAIAVTLIVGTLIGITVPERLRRHQWALEAAENARAYALHRALLEYRDLHGTLPPQEDLVRQLRTLPDPDGSIAEALNVIDPNGYEAESVQAAAAPKTKRLARGAALRDASLTTAPDPPAISFTNYNLRLPGPDKKLNTDDDLIIRDGLVMTVSEFAAYRSPRSSAP